MPRLLPLLASTLGVGLLLALLPSPAGADPGDSTTFDSNLLADPLGITVGGDGNLWFANSADHRIGRITPAGQVTTFADPDGEVLIPQGMATAPDGSVWFTSTQNGRIGRIDPNAANPAASITTYADPAGLIDNPFDLTAGPDGLIWFTSRDNDRVGHLDPSAPNPATTIATLPVGATSWPESIASAEGALWITLAGKDDIARVSTAGALTSYSAQANELQNLSDITTGPDGAAWWVTGEGAFGRATGGVGVPPTVQLFDTNDAMAAVTTGPDGNLWAANFFGGINRLTPRGGARDFTVEDSDAFADIVLGPDGALWATDPGYEQIARIEAFPPHGFTDVAPAAFFEDGLDWARHEGLITGFPDNTYRSQSPVNRGQIVNMLWHLVGAPNESEAHGFVDIPPNAFYRHALRWAKANELVAGFPGNQYRPKSPVLRGQLVNMLWNLAGQPTGDPAHGFPDVPAGAFYDQGLSWARAHGLVTGFPDGTFHPKDAVTRGQVASILYNLARDPEAWASSSFFAAAALF